MRKCGVCIEGKELKTLGLNGSSDLEGRGRNIGKGRGERKYESKANYKVEKNIVKS